MGVGVTGHRGADIASLDIQDSQRTGGRDFGQYACQNRNSRRSKRFEKSRLRFEGRYPIPHRGDQFAANPFGPGQIGFITPGTHQAGVGIDTDTQIAAVSYQGAQPILETSHRFVTRSGMVKALMP